MVELRRTLLLPIDDLLVITREFVNPGASRSGLDRCLRRHGVSNLIALRAQNGEPAPAAKTYKDYEPGFVHMDIKYLPQMPDETQRRYLFVAIARGPHAGSSFASTTIRARSAVATSCGRCTRPRR